jgi:hypothetical protein
MAEIWSQPSRGQRAPRVCSAVRSVPMDRVSVSSYGSGFIQMQRFFPSERQGRSSFRQPRMGRFTSTVAMLFGVLSSACYSSRDLAPAAVQPGSGVRISLTSEGARAAGEFTGAAALGLSGTALGWAADTLRLEVWRTDVPQGRTFQPGRIVVPLHLNGIERITQRSLSPARSTAMAVGSGVLLHQLYRWIWRDTGARGDTPAPPLAIGPRVPTPTLRH